MTVFLVVILENSYKKMCSVRNVLKKIIIVKIYYIKISVYGNKDIYAKAFFLSIEYPQKY